MKIIIKNFQSINNCELDIPERAFTCIVGSSNIGKSAIRRALECVFYNKSDSSYIRNGSDSCEVEVTFEDGTNIWWTRTKKGDAKYKINGEPFEKLSRTVPQILIDKGFFELNANKEKYSVQIAPQFDNLFLLNQTGSKVTEVISNLGNLNKIINSNRLCATDLRSVKSKLNVRREDLNLVKDKFKKYSGLDEQSNKLNTLKDFLLDIKNKKQKLELVKNLSTSFNHSSEILKVLAPLDSLDVSHLNIDIHKFLSIQVLYQQFSVVSYRLGIFKNIPEKEIFFDLDNIYKRYINTVYISNILDKSKNKLLLYKKIPKEVISIENIDLNKLNVAKDFHHLLLKTKENILKIRKDIEKTDKKLNDLIQEKETLHTKLKVCPLCDKPF